jgi:DNA helicase II / ATP-dependent DNA helicase PcrA
MTNPEQLLAGLDPEQQAVATALHGPVCVLAGAGTGKTRAITHRIAYGVAAGVYQPGQLLAVTFTARAAGELRGRLRGLGAGGVQARTFHSAALRQLQFFWPNAVGGPAPRLMDSKLPLVAAAATACRLRTDRTELRDLASEIEWAKSTGAGPEDYPAAVVKAERIAPRDPAELARVYAAYEEHKRDRGMIDFEDVLLLTIGVLDSRPDIADRVRDQYRYFVVDEYQDVNPLQQRLLDCWLGARDSVCVVGDASQTIYSFTGATPEYLLGFPDRYPDSTLVRLVRDYRSTPQVVSLANALLEAAPKETPAQKRSARARVELIAQRPAGQPVSFTAHPDGPAEAEAVTKQVKQLIASGTRPADIAVLFRINAQSELFEQAFADQGIPYVVRGAERYFERPEVRQALLLLRGAARAGGDGEAGPDVIAMPDLVRAVLAGNGWQPAPPQATGRARETWESLSALVALAQEYAGEHPAASLTDFVRELEERASLQHAPTVDGVTLASLHSAKGLEWDTVFLVGLIEGLMPISYAETPDQVEEERRLFYVGVTRAQTRLYLSWALAREPGGRAGRLPSRFLDVAVDEQSNKVVDTVGAVLRRGSAKAPGGKSAKRSGPIRCRVCGRSLIEPVERKLGRCEDCPSNIDEALFERLREWRAARAQEQSVPAYCIFTDATLTAIAESRPADRAALAVIPGVGGRKLDRYADDVLAILNP